MSEPWCDKFPDDYRDAVIKPVEYEWHADGPAQSRRVWGFDLGGRRCFYQHEFTLSEDRFDAEEFPIWVDIFWERVTAWRLRSGRWLKQRTWSDRLDRCPRRYVSEPFEEIDENQLQSC